MSQHTQPLGASIHRAVLRNIHLARVQRPDHEELYLSASAPQGGLADPRAQAATLYGEVAALLSEHNGVVVQERLYGALAAQPQAEAGRAQALQGLSAFGDVPPTYLEGLPCSGEGLAGVHLCAVAGADVQSISHGGLPIGRAVDTPAATYLYLSGLRGTTPNEPLPRVEQALRAFGKANEALASQGFTYRDVVRTWIYIHDILAWYDDFNQARNEAYRQFGLLGSGEDYLPASTGIQGRSPGHLELTMDLLAARAKPGSDLETARLHNPLQNEAYAYGSAFARAMEVVTGGARTIYVSGTAPIDEFGDSMHQDDIDAQIERTVRNVEALIGTRGLTLDDLAQATVFLKHPQHYDRFLRVCAGTRLAEVGVCMVADVCREELLFEFDAVAAGLV